MARSRRAFLAAAGAVAAAGCAEFGAQQRAGGPTETAPTETTPTEAGAEATTPAPEPSVTDVSLLLNWKPSGLHTPYYVARSEGFYEDQGLDVREIKSGQGSDFSARQVGLGNEAFAITSADQVLNVASRELSPLCVGVVMQQSPAVVFAAREHFGEPLTDVEQLAGKTVGTGPGMVRVLTKLLLEREGVLDQVDIVDTGYDTIQQLLGGEIDAAGGVFGDVVDASHHEYTIDEIPVASAVPSYGHVIATSESFAADHPETVRAFLRATARGMAHAARSPGAATDALVEAVPALEESRDRQRDRWELMHGEYVRSETVERQGWGWSTAEPWTTVRDALDGADVLGGSVDPDAVWTNEFLDAEYRFVGEYDSVVSS